MLYLCEIEDVFELNGRGCVVVPGVPHALAPDARVRVGTALLIVTPAGDELGTTISGIEMIDRGRPLSHAPFSVPPAITKKQLPIGSKVYALQDPAA